MNLDLVRDVLDKRILDRDANIIGRVDGLVMHLPERGPPRITHLSVGGSQVFDRVGGWATRIARRVRSAFGPSNASPTRIPWSKIEHFGRDVKLSLTADQAGTMAWERWVRKRVISHIPGSGAK